MIGLKPFPDEVSNLNIEEKLTKSQLNYLNRLKDLIVDDKKKAKLQKPNCSIISNLRGMEFLYTPSSQF